jgi:hypothetical protein
MLARRMNGYTVGLWHGLTVLLVVPRVLKTAEPFRQRESAEGMPKHALVSEIQAD